MFKCISIYPSSEDNYLNKCEEYIKLASQYNFDEVFTSLHIPELSLTSQIYFLHNLAKLSKKYNMQLIADIGGNSIKQIIADKQLLELLIESDVNFLRLDYGYNHKDIKYLSGILNNDGFIINASIYDGRTSRDEVNFIRSLNKQVRACHNFYPREESGIDSSFAFSQKQIFDALDVPIYYCVANIDNPRGPVFAGLTTLEKHRYMNIKDSLNELVNTYNADGILFADNFYPEECFVVASNIEINGVIDIKVHTNNDKYDDIVYKTHEFRYDSNDNYLRSKSSRQMAEYARVIESDNCIERKRGSITIDNKLYGRYSGELQVVLQDHEADKRVNVIGYIDEEDLMIIARHRSGYKYRFNK